MRRLFSVILAFVIAVSLGAAAEMPAGVTLKKNGSFTTAEAEMLIKIYADNWARTNNSQWYDVKSSAGKNGLDLTGRLKVNGVEGTVTEKITPTSADTFHFSCRYAFSRPTQLNICCATVFIPTEGGATVRLDGEDFPLPAAFKNMTLLNRRGLKEVRFVLAEGRILTVRGDLEITVQDNRKFNTDTFSFRFHFTPKNGRQKEAALDLDFSVNDTASMAVDLGPAATRGFVYDGKQGWTDQGKDNDLRAFTRREVRSGGLSFVIADPAKNNGKAAVVLGGGNKTAFPHRVKVALPAMKGARALNLLHASAWTPGKGQPLGSLRVAYADGSEQVIPVESRRDCGNWWNPENAPNANVAWSAENESSAIGLYASSFALEKEGAAAVTLEAAAPEALWMVAGASLSSDPVHFSSLADRDVVIHSGHEWTPLEFSREVAAGSPLDFSWVLKDQAPAGRFGRIINKDGHFAFEKAPDRRVRLFGANLCFTASYLDKAEVDRLVPRLARLGYNTMRIHHHDTEILDRSAADSLTFNPEKLDRLDYLFAKLKENGFYITTDLYTNRVFKKGDGIPECTFFNERQMKMLVPISAAALGNWKEFARRFMSHKNPYTGMTWGEDPALFMLNLVNEENLANCWAGNPASAKLYREVFARWAEKNGLKNARADNSDRDFRRFLDETEGACHAEQIRFCKEELKVKAFITSLNWQNDVPLALMRARFDVVDNHSYFDHPSFPERPWQMPYGYRQRCAIDQMAAVPRTMMPTRIFGKPFTVTEFNYCAPNLHRAEGGALIGAYPALQDWDALYRFAWSHSDSGIVKPQGMSGFDAVNDPLAQLLDRITVAMFIRGDVTPARERIAYAVPAAIHAGDAPFNYPESFSRLGLIAQIGSHPENAPLPAGVTELDAGRAKDPAAVPAVREAWSNAVEKRLAVSSTGEITLDAKKKTFAVNTPRCLSATLPGGSLRAGALQVANASCFQNVTAISLDGAPVEKSASVLVLHLTNAMNSNAVMGNERWTIMRKNGELPVLVKRGWADVSLKTGRAFKVTALRLDGTPADTVEGRFADGRFTFPVSTTKGIVAYHLTR